MRRKGVDKGRGIFHDARRAMQDLLRTVTLGLGAGALDAMLAFGIVLIYRTTGVLNFAQAATGAFAAYAAFAVSQGRPLWLAVMAGLLVGAGLGVGTYAAVGRLQAGNYALSAAVATLAVSILIRQLISIFWGTTFGLFPDPFQSSGVSIGQGIIRYSVIAAIATAAILALTIGALLRWTRQGTMIRALADNPTGAVLCGANPQHLLIGVWAAGGLLGAIAGMYVAQSGLSSPSFLDPYLIGALIAAVLGGLRSLTGTFFGAMGLEIARNLFLYYAPQHFSYDLTPYTNTFVIVVLIAILILAPRRWLGHGMERRI
jgi:branched-chain amino acid transport system permease protein